MVRRFESGEQILIRHVFRGRVLHAVPARVVDAGMRSVTTWIVPGTRVAYPDGANENGDLKPLDEWKVTLRPWFGNGVLDVTPFGRAHMIRHFWGEDGAFRGWYVNLQDSLRPTPRGFDTRDHLLDLWIEADGSVRWKDEHHLEQAVGLGVMSREEAQTIREEGERVLGEWPFPTGWEDFRPDSEWPIPELSGLWQEPSS